MQLLQKNRRKNKLENIISCILDYYNSISIEFDVYIVADIQEKTKKITPEQIIHSDESEFFSRTEFAEISSAIYYCFGFVRVFYSELEFIKYVLENNITSNDCIVYNFARDGRANGKKSLLPSFCDLLDIKYTGSDAFVISLLRNKYVYTKLLESNKISVPKSAIFSATDDMKILNNMFKEEYVIIKNKYESASIGLSKNNIFCLNESSQEYIHSVLTELNTDSLLIQEYIEGIECEVLVLKYKGEFYALDPVEIVFRTDYHVIDTITSNTYNYGFRVLDNPVKKIIQKSAIKSAQLLGIKDYARFDFRIKDNIPYLIDIAGTPYTIHHSSIAFLFTKHYQLPYETIYKIIVACMLSNYNQK